MKELKLLLCTLFMSFVFCSCETMIDFFSGEDDEENAEENSNNGEYSIAHNFSAVDLGLSVKWANMNLGASSSVEFGKYYAWGELAPKKQYDWTTYKFSAKGSSNMTKYCFSSLGQRDCLDTLEEEDDAVSYNKGGDWRMPTLDEMNELCSKCTWIWTGDFNGSGKCGYIVQSNVNNNFIFLPAAGHAGGDFEYTGDEMGMYWTSSLDVNSFGSIKAAQIYFGSGDLKTMSYDREIGMTIRPVCGKRNEAGGLKASVSGQIQGHDYVDLALPSRLKWATCNVGASKPLSKGELYAWGETNSNSEYTDKSYKFANPYNSFYFLKYGNEDGEFTTLKSEDDAASVNWGSSWRMPTSDEFDELIDNCEWSIQKGLFVGVSKNNGKIIILPGCGYMDDDMLRNNDNGYYWTSELSERSFAYIYEFNGSGGYYFHTFQRRSLGSSIRAVAG